jgi:hypothetical protein
MITTPTGRSSDTPNELLTTPPELRRPGVLNSYRGSSLCWHRHYFGCREEGKDGTRMLHSRSPLEVPWTGALIPIVPNVTGLSRVASIT